MCKCARSCEKEQRGRARPRPSCTTRLAECQTFVGVRTNPFRGKSDGQKPGSTHQLQAHPRFLKPISSICLCRRLWSTCGTRRELCRGTQMATASRSPTDWCVDSYPASPQTSNPKPQNPPLLPHSWATCVGLYCGPFMRENASSKRRKHWEQ